jgi:hypothetical protein
MTQHITIATTIAPRNIELQQRAIAGWQHLGFDVISVNSIIEVESVRDYFPTVNFAVVHRTAESQAGTPYPYFDDLLKALSESGAEICGIVNSDVFLKADANFREFIDKEARGSVLFGSRTDVEYFGHIDGEIYHFGFDFFFFNKNILGLYPRSSFCIGAPWWDYWAVTIPLSQGVVCRELLSPVAFHLKHDIKWKSELLVTLGTQFHCLLKQSVFSFLAETEQPKSEAEALFLTTKVLQHILRVSEKLMFTHTPAINCRLPVRAHIFTALRDVMVARGMSRNSLDCTIELQKRSNRGISLFVHVLIFYNRCLVYLLRKALKMVRLK